MSVVLAGFDVGHVHICHSWLFLEIPICFVSYYLRENIYMSLVDNFEFPIFENFTRRVYVLELPVSVSTREVLKASA